MEGLDFERRVDVSGRAVTTGSATSPARATESLKILRGSSLLFVCTSIAVSYSSFGFGDILVNEFDETFC